MLAHLIKNDAAAAKVMAGVKFQAVSFHHKLHCKEDICYEHGISCSCSTVYCMYRVLPKTTYQRRAAACLLRRCTSRLILALLEDTFGAGLLLL
jgi:hypothetical protein